MLTGVSASVCTRVPSVGSVGNYVERLGHGLSAPVRLVMRISLSGCTALNKDPDQHEDSPLSTGPSLDLHSKTRPLNDV